MNWISVKDRLPEDGVCVFVYIPEMEHGFGIEKATYGIYWDKIIKNNGFGWRLWPNHDMFFWTNSVTHWAELPEPPKA